MNEVAYVAREYHSVDKLSENAHSDSLKFLLDLQTFLHQNS